MNIPDTILRWALVDIKKIDHSFDGVSISKDGTRVAGLSNNLIASYIMILDANNGNLINSRYYKLSNSANISEGR